MFAIKFLLWHEKKIRSNEMNFVLSNFFNRFKILCSRKKLVSKYKASISLLLSIWDEDK